MASINNVFDIQSYLRHEASIDSEVDAAVGLTPSVQYTVALERRLEDTTTTARLAASQATAERLRMMLSNLQVVHDQPLNENKHLHSDIESLSRANLNDRRGGECLVNFSGSRRTTRRQDHRQELKPASSSSNSMAESDDETSAAIPLDPYHHRSPSCASGMAFLSGEGMSSKRNSMNSMVSLLSTASFTEGGSIRRQTSMLSLLSTASFTEAGNRRRPSGTSCASGVALLTSMGIDMSFASSSSLELLNSRRNRGHAERRGSCASGVAFLMGGGMSFASYTSKQVDTHSHTGNEEWAEIPTRPSEGNGRNLHDFFRNIETFVS